MNTVFFLQTSLKQGFSYFVWSQLDFTNDAFGQKVFN